MKRFTRMVAAVMLTTTLPAVAAVEVTSFSSTNTVAGGVGDVTIEFTTDEANFGPAQGGGWAATATLPAGMSTNGAYVTQAQCSSTTIELTPVSGFTPYCVELAGRYVVSNQNGLGTSTVIGQGNYTLTIRNVTNPNSVGPITLSEFSVWDATSGNVLDGASNVNLNLSTNVITLSASSSSTPATAVPTLPLFGLLALGGLLGLFGLRKLYK